MRLNMRPLRSELSLPASVWNKLQGANTDFNCATERSWRSILDWYSWWCCAGAVVLVVAIGRSDSSASRASSGALFQERCWIWRFPRDPFLSFLWFVQVFNRLINTDSCEQNTIAGINCKLTIVEALPQFWIRSFGGIHAGDTFSNVLSII